MNVAHAGPFGSRQRAPLPIGRAFCRAAPKALVSSQVQLPDRPYLNTAHLGYPLRLVDAKPNVL
jgi:hypothetical protein